MLTRIDSMVTLNTLSADINTYIVSQHFPVKCGNDASEAIMTFRRKYLPLRLHLKSNNNLKINVTTHRLQ